MVPVCLLLDLHFLLHSYFSHYLLPSLHTDHDTAGEKTKSDLAHIVWVKSRSALRVEAITLWFKSMNLVSDRLMLYTVLKEIYFHI